MSPACVEVLRRLIPILVTALSVGAAGATQSRTINIEELAGRAATIFAGRCLEVRNESDPTLGGDVTVATFQVDRSVKGSPGETITVRMPGTGDAWTPAGVPGFVRGEEVVLFLYGESSIGMRAPVGLGQGRFRIVVDKLGSKLAINEFGNRNLMHGLSEGAQARLADPASIADEGKLSPEKLLDAVEDLLRPRP